MKNKKFIGVFLVTIFFLLLFIGQVSASSVTINLFYSKTCPHCSKELPFVQNLAAENSDVYLRTFDVGKQENAQIMQDTLTQLGELYRGIPVTVISDKVIVGYSSDATTGEEIISIIDSVRKTGDLDIVDQVMDEGEETVTPSEIIKPTVMPTESPTEKTTAEPAEVMETVSEEPGNESTPKKTETESETITPETAEPTEIKEYSSNPRDKKFEVPILGEISAGQFSLPVLTIVLGLLDGFNPCAMWALLFLISLLLGMKDRMRMWILGVAFIATSAFVYFLFMTAWLNFFIFLGYVPWIQKGIGFFALGVGVYNLYDYFFNKDSGCKGEQIDKKRKIFSKLKEVALQKNFLVAILGIIALAFAVNLVELVCSAGLPAIYTQVLSLSDLSTWQYYGYMFLYILFFMIDDLFVFFVAMITLKAIGIENKYAKFSGLLGGIVIFIIGLILLLRPELLAFG